MGAPLKLPTPSAIAMKILGTILRADFSSQDLAHLIETDPALTVKVIGYANPPFYAGNGDVKSVKRAIDVLGIKVVSNIALSFSIVDALWDRGTKGFDYENFWKASVVRAAAANIFARFPGCSSEDAFVVALLADVGKVLMFMARPGEYLRVQEGVRGTGAKDCEVERRIFTCDHQDIGGETLKSWGMPESIYLPVASHHEGPCGKGDSILLARTVLRVCTTTDILASRSRAK